ncbi:hypothetical protein [Actinoplanes aureus]|uniref:Uncharacterized protein n=1 Tax=Actinoplanes aureus TaxID=2792083 RepID=A0A931CGV6_9ACTN|nr:hypothetical protein [Actinoplanes aureus]MBG0565893.1 hypothetical protein [Actinoplanes aureus]
MSHPSHRQLATEMLASLGGKFPGTPSMIAAAHAHAVLALADEVAALRQILQGRAGDPERPA